MNDVITIDAANSKRWVEESTGYMHVADNRLTKATVDGYLGSEIMGGDDIGLESERVYQVYRPANELAQGLQTLSGVPILNDHPEEVVTAENFEKYKDWVIGSVGTDIRFEDPYVLGSLVFHDANAIDGIESEKKRQLSCGYVYVPALESGMFDGQPYEIKMTKIRFNHLALVKKGRVDGVMVNDGKPHWGEKSMEKEDKHEADTKDEAPPEEKKEGAEDQQPVVLADTAPAGAAPVEGAPATVTSDDVDARIAALEAELAQLRASKVPSADQGPPAMVQQASDGQELPNTGIASKGIAMDSNKIFEEVSRRLEGKYRLRDEALDAVRPLVGDIRVSAMDSADKVYEYALKQHGVEVSKDVNLAGLQGMVAALMRGKTRDVLGGGVDFVATDSASGKLDEYEKLLDDKQVRVLG